MKFFCHLGTIGFKTTFFHIDFFCRPFMGCFVSYSKPSKWFQRYYKLTPYPHLTRERNYKNPYGRRVKARRTWLDKIQSWAADKMDYEYNRGWDMKVDGETGWRLTLSFWKYNLYCRIYSIMGGK